MRLKKRKVQIFDARNWVREGEKRREEKREGEVLIRGFLGVQPLVQRE